MNRIIFSLIAVLVVAVFSLAGAEDLTNSYVSLNGKFYIHYPADWDQVPHIEIDRYLALKKAGRPVYDYEAVLAPKGTQQFFLGSYLFLTIDTIPGMTNNQVDSVILDVQKTFGKDVRYFPVADFMADLESDVPNYDKEKKIISISNKIVQNETTSKYLLLIKKFYNNGVANFYFYAPEATFNNQKKLFTDIVNTFSTEDISTQLPKENLKVADIEKLSDEDESDDGANISYFLPFIGLALIVIIIASRKKRKKE